MNGKYIIKRILVLIATIILAASVNFLIPRLTPQDPIAALMGKMASKGQTVVDADEMIERYRQQFGMDDPLFVQYIKYLRNVILKGDLGYSISYFPAKVSDVIIRAIPYSISLLAVANIIAFVIGNLLGAVCVWGKNKKFLKKVVYFMMPFSSIPYYILALMLLYIFAILVPVLPIGGVATAGSVGGFTLSALLDVVKHAILPIMSVVLSLVGFWALSMRGAMATVLGEDYLLYAQARGLKPKRIFYSYAMRNAMLPQVTAFAIDIGKVISGAVLVEIIFNYPGVGNVLYNALRNADYFVIQGVVMFIVVSVAVVMFIVDLIYPKLDPRIRYE